MASKYRLKFVSSLQAILTIYRYNAIIGTVGARSKVQEGAAYKVQEGVLYKVQSPFFRKIFQEVVAFKVQSEIFFF